MVRVVITGLGAVTHLGFGHESLAQGLMSVENRNAMRWISSEQQVELKGYRIDDSKLAEHLVPFKTRNMDRFAKINIAAVQLALEDASLNVDDLEETGYIMNTTYGPWESTNRYTKELVESGPAFASPRLFPNTVVNSAQGHVSITFKMKGPTSTLAGLSAIPYAVSLLTKGEAERVIVAGADELNENIMEAYKELGSPVIFGEGVGVLILETFEHATRRGAQIYAEIGDYAIGSEPTMNLWFEGADATSLIYEELVSEISLNREKDSLLVLSSTNGSQIVDRLEENVMQSLKHTYPKLEVFYPKHILGETFGASSVLSVISAIHLLNNHTEVNDALLLNNEIGGNHIALIIKKWND